MMPDDQKTERFWEDYYTAREDTWPRKGFLKPEPPVEPPGRHCLKCGGDMPYGPHKCGPTYRQLMAQLRREEARVRWQEENKKAGKPKTTLKVGGKRVDV